MTKILTAIALAIALPAVAHAQAAPTPAPKADCCEKMKAAVMDCTSMTGKMDMTGAKMGHGMKQPAAPQKPSQPGQHQNHKLQPDPKN